MIFVSPAEPPSLRALGTSASWVEFYGVDFFWIANGKTFGVQRKEVRDLVASLHDDRLARELMQMQTLDHPAMLVEGNWQWVKGLSERLEGRFTRAQYTGIVCSLQYEHGLTIFETSSIQSTADAISRIAFWTEKAEHGTLLSRSAAPKIGTRDQWVWILQGCGFGRKTAEAVIDHFGRLPLNPTCSYTELCQVPGVGPKRARAFLERFTDARDEGEQRSVVVGE